MDRTAHEKTRATRSGREDDGHGHEPGWQGIMGRVQGSGVSPIYRGRLETSYGLVLFLIV